jgi:drug/metabolite transporter (DMT)-like permease
VTRRLDWDDPNARRPPRHPYRDSALLYGAMGLVILLVAWLTGGSVARAAVVAGAAFVGATAWSWWRWRERLADAERRSR